ncbi:MAG: hypothetical protein ACFWUA_02840 [Sporanaerobacter sp.]
MKNTEEFKPYIPADKVLPEFSPTAIIVGILMSIVFGAANAYIGLRDSIWCWSSSFWRNIKPYQIIAFDIYNF